MKFKDCDETLMNILLVTSNYFPEPSGIARYTTDLSRLLKENGHRVTVLTGLPHYPWWKVVQKNETDHPGSHTIEGINVIRCRQWVPNKFNVITRLIYEFVTLINFSNGSKNSLAKEYDLVLSYIPTIASAVVGCRNAKLSDCRFGIIVQDLSGKGASQSGQRGGRLVGKIAEWLEHKVIFKADSIAVVSAEMKNSLEVSAKKGTHIRYIPNYYIEEIPLRDKHLSRLNLGWDSDEFVLVHAGNIGAKQDLQSLAGVMKQLEKFPNFRLRIVGHGNSEENLKNMTSLSSNIEILGMVPFAEYPTVLAAADLLVINERPTQLNMSLPSKLTTYLLSNRPILAVVPKNGATWKFLSGISHLVEPGDPKIVADRILYLSKNQIVLDQAARRGLDFAQENLSTKQGHKNYLDWIQSLFSISKDRF